MACGNFVLLQICDAAYPHLIASGAGGGEVIGLEDQHIAAGAFFIDKALRWRVAADGHNDLQELIANRKDSIGQAEVSNFRVDKWCTKAEQLLQALYIALVLAGDNKLAETKGSHMSIVPRRFFRLYVQQ